MKLSDLSVERPVFATVVSIMLVAFGVLSFLKLPVREYPDIDAPIVSVETVYTGAAAETIETQITERIEEQISGLEGIRSIQSTSRDGSSNIVVEFSINRNVDEAANDVRDRVSRVIGSLPREADPPQIYKVDSNTDVIAWFNLSSTVMDSAELTDYAERFIIDRLSVVEGVARVRIGGEHRFAMRVWLDRIALAARGLTVADVEAALEAENVELPAGRIESTERDFTVRMHRGYRGTADFSRLVLKQGPDGHVVRLGDVARVERGVENYRTDFRGNGEPMVGLGIIRQSKANTLDVVDAVRNEITRIRKTLPRGTRIFDSYDSSIFIRSAITEVYKTLAITSGLVIFVIFLFLGSLRATLIPAVTVPVSITASFMVLAWLGFSINLLTLLALVLAIGLVVDDSIVVLENVYRRARTGEPPLLAATRGARQVAFAVIATTAVLVAVFVPLAFVEGNIGKLFTELAFAISAAVVFSSVVALSLSPMMSSKLFVANIAPTRLETKIQDISERLGTAYRASVEKVIDRPLIIGVVVLALLGLTALLFRAVPSEFTPREDRGAFFVIMKAPEGSGFQHTLRYARDLETKLMPLIRNGEAIRALIRVPGSFQQNDDVNSARGIVLLKLWNERKRSTDEIMSDLRKKFATMPGVRTFPVMRSGIGGGDASKPVQIVIGGTSYAELAAARDIIRKHARGNPGFVGIDDDYKETKPKMLVTIDQDRAADLGVSVQAIGRTLETMFGSRRVTTFLDRGQEYDVILQGRDEDRRSANDLTNVYVRSARTGELIPLSNLVTLTEQAAPGTLNRYNRLRAITIEANLAPGYTLGEALDFLEAMIAKDLPQVAAVNYKGESREFKESSGALLFTFVLAMLVVFLVLAAQFESFIHPLIIMLTVPFGIVGALLTVWLTGGTLNIYSQIGMIVLIGLAAKNGILIVEFANQLRDEGLAVRDALLEAITIRLRPILMTAVSTAAGAIPLILASGAGAESRTALGIVIFSGIITATILTLYIVPVFYARFAPYTRSPGYIAAAIKRLRRERPEATPAE